MGYQRVRRRLCARLDFTSVGGALEHDPEQRIPVFGRDHAPGLRIGGQFIMRAVHKGRKRAKSDMVIQRRRAARLWAALAITISLVSLGAMDPAFAQFRGGDIRPMSVGPRPPSSFGGSTFGNVGRVDPGLRLMPNDGGAGVSTCPQNPRPRSEISPAGPAALWPTACAGQ